MAKTKTQKRIEAMERLIALYGEPQTELIPMLTQAEIEKEMNEMRAACKAARLQFNEESQKSCVRKATWRIKRKEKGWSEISNLRWKLHGYR